MSCTGIYMGCREAVIAMILAGSVIAAPALSQVHNLFGSALETSTNLTGGTVTRPITPGSVLPPPPPELQRPVGGALPALFRSPQPLQMINPLAPAEYGDGTQHLATNLVTGQAEGVTLFSIRLPTKPHKVKKEAPVKKRP